MKQCISTKFIALILRCPLEVNLNMQVCPAKSFEITEGNYHIFPNAQKFGSSIMF